MPLLSKSCWEGAEIRMKTASSRNFLGLFDLSVIHGFLRFKVVARFLWNGGVAKVDKGLVVAH